MRLKSFRNKPGTILDAFDDLDGHHYGTIMVVTLPKVMAHTQHPDHIAIVILKQNIPAKHHSPHSPRGSVGLWSDCRVEHVK